MSLAPIQDMALIKVPENSNEAFSRLDVNLKYFKINYMIFVLLSTTIVLTIINPWFLVAVFVLLAAAAFLIANKEPIKVGDNNFLKVTVLARIYLITGLVFYSAFGGVAFLLSFGIGFLICVAHGVLTEVEATRKLKSITSSMPAKQDASDMERGAAQLIARSYELLCFAIGLKESNEIYNMSSVPSYVAKEIKSEFKELKNNIKNIFNE